MRLELSKIRRDGGTQIRVTLCEHTIAEYSEAIQDGKALPPATVFRDAAGEHWLADGFHRFHAYERSGRKHMPVKIIDGELRDAIRFALSANTDHGLRRTNADKRNAVLVALADPEWSQLSDNKIAQLCGVTHPFVGKVRKEQEGCNGYNPQIDETPENKGSGESEPVENSQEPPTLTSDQPSSLNDDPPVSPEPPLDFGGDDDTDADDSPADDAVVITLKGGPLDKWTTATLTLPDHLAQVWRQMQAAIAEREAANRKLAAAIDVQCKLRRVNRSEVFQRLSTDTSERWVCKMLRQAMAQLKKYDPICPCPNCLETPSVKCSVCDGSQWVTKDAWDSGWFQPGEKLRLIDKLGGATQ